MPNIIASFGCIASPTNGTNHSAALADGVHRVGFQFEQGTVRIPPCRVHVRVRVLHAACHNHQHSPALTNTR